MRNHTRGNPVEAVKPANSSREVLSLTWLELRSFVSTSLPRWFAISVV